MKRTLAIILSVMMLIASMPFAGIAADYDRAKVAENNEEYIDALSAEQIATIALDWVDRQIAKYSQELEDVIVDGVVTNGFEGFEIAAFGDVIAEQIPDITCLDDVIAYKSYLTELGGDFAKLDATNLITREEAGTSLDFIYGVFEFMADNSEIFGKVFRWDGYTIDENGAVTFDGTGVFDYGKVGKYIETLQGTDEQEIYDFYINYLVGNDIQSKFVNWVAGQMGYTPAEGETFDDVLHNGILGWFSGVCEDMGILSDDALSALNDIDEYDLRTMDIYTLIEKFVGLVQTDNEVEINTYYNYLMDTVVRSLLKTALGQKAVAGADVTLPDSFAATYTDLELLAEISGGQLYYQDGTNYYQVTITDGVASAKALTWETVVDFEFPTATIYTGADFDKEVQVYYPTSADAVQVLSYATAKNQALIGDALTFSGTEVPAEFAALMTDENAKALEDGFGLTVKQGEEVISQLNITFKEIEEYAEAQALPVAQEALTSALASLPMTIDVTLESIDVVLSYNGYATDDEFICQVTVDSVTATLSGSMASLVQSAVDSAATSAVGTTIDNPVATIVVDGISGGKGIDASGAKELLEFLDTDFVIDAELLNFAANYDEYNGVVGQANRVLYDLVDMLVSDAGMEKLALEEGMNDKFTSNLEKICATANDMMASAEAIMTDPEVEALLGQAGIDMSALLGSFDLDLLYAIDFSSVEALWVSVINLGLDLIDDGSNETLAEIHAVVNDLENLDAMAVAMTDYLLGKCIPELNAALEEAELDFVLSVPSKTDATAVVDGTGKDIIMTKLVDVIYEAATEGVDLVNEIVNDILADLSTETGLTMPTVAFELKVEKGADWEETLAALTNRVYDLVSGIVIACDNDYTETFDKISAVANAILPLGSLASNCASDNFAFDIAKVFGFIFDDGLEGNLDGFLRLYETDEKTADVAANCSVTESLINASEHIVDSIFPDTVTAEKYVNVDYTTVSFTETTVQEYFTSAENDQVIASQNMDSIYARREALVPAVLNLVREAGVLPFLACGLDHDAADLEVVDVEGKAATCTEAGYKTGKACAECGAVVVKGDTIPKLGHNYKGVVTKAPTCTQAGVMTYTCANDETHVYTESISATGHTMGGWYAVSAATCTAEGLEKRDCANCTHSETRTVAVTSHPDVDGNKVCDACSYDWNEKEQEDNSFFGKIKAFFQKIIDWFKNLFS